MLAICIYLYLCGIVGFGALFTLLHFEVSMERREMFGIGFLVLVWPLSTPIVVAISLMSFAYDEWAWRVALRNGR